MTNSIRDIIEKQFKRWADEDDIDETWEPCDVKDFAEQVAKEVIEQTIAITRMNALRNGHDSLENVLIEKARNDIKNYFNVDEVDVNVIFDKNEFFRAFYNLPRKGDKAYDEQ